MEKFIHFNIIRKTNTDYSMMIDDGFLSAVRLKTGNKDIGYTEIVDAFSNSTNTDEKLREACIEIISVLGWRNTEILEEHFGSYSVTVNPC